ncbi:hypothetical protein MRX96_019765 [Rhipicephalus microplus]
MSTVVHLPIERRGVHAFWGSSGPARCGIEASARSGSTAFRGARERNHCQGLNALLNGRPCPVYVAGRALGAAHLERTRTSLATEWSPRRRDAQGPTSGDSSLARRGRSVLVRGGDDRSRLLFRQSNARRHSPVGGRSGLKSTLSRF